MPNSSGDWPLRSLLDHTHSQPGARILENLLSHPLSDRNEIIARQDLLRALPAVTQHINWKTLDGLIRSTSTYLDSNFIVFPTTAFEPTVFALQYRNIAKFVETHVATAAHFIELSATLHDTLRVLPADARFREMLRAFDTIFETTLRDEVRSAVDSNHSRRLNICRLDARFRQDLREPLLALISAYHTLDAFCSLATTAATPGLSFAHMPTDRTAQFDFRALRHPAVKNPEPNNVALRDTERVMFVTGPNMAGKSTLLRALALQLC